ncbi:MAG: hypothetical protein E7Z65_08450 [Thermoplasmata archaeon]|nr:hypothetical protein [Thermoplasmata archaeon]
MEQTNRLLLRSSPSADLGPEMGLRLGHALAKDYHKVVIGTDLIKSSSMMKNAVISGLISCGADVIDVGIVSAPVAANAAKMGDCCVYVTEFRQLDLISGYLLINPDGGLFGKEQIRHLEGRDMEKPELSDYKNLGTVKRYYNALQDYNAKLLGLLNDTTGGTVILNSNCGMATDSAPQILNGIGTDTISLNAQKDRNYVSNSLSTKEADIHHMRDMVASDAGSIGISINRIGTLLRVFNESGDPLTDIEVLKVIILYIRPTKIVVPMDISGSVEDLFKMRIKINVKTTYPIPDPEKMEIIYAYPNAGSIHKAMVESGADIGYYDGGFIFSNICQMPDAIHACMVLAQFSGNNNLKKTVDSFPDYYSDRKPYKYSCNTTDFIRAMNSNLPEINPVKIYENEGWRVELEGGRFYVSRDTEDSVMVTAESNDRLYLISMMEVIDNLMAECENGQ